MKVSISNEVVVYHIRFELCALSAILNYSKCQATIERHPQLYDSSDIYDTAILNYSLALVVFGQY